MAKIDPKRGPRQAQKREIGLTPKEKQDRPKKGDRTGPQRGQGHAQKGGKIVQQRGKDKLK